MSNPKNFIRNEEIVRQRLMGLSFRQIAELWGIDVRNVYTIYERDKSLFKKVVVDK